MASLFRFFLEVTKELQRGKHRLIKSLRQRQTTLQQGLAPGAAVGGKDGVAADIFPPCGVCRQVMQEFCEPGFMIYMGRSDGSYVAESLGAMLPYGFTAEKYMK